MLSSPFRRRHKWWLYKEAQSVDASIVPNMLLASEDIKQKQNEQKRTNRCIA